jgi:hypothetical protein
MSKSRALEMFQSGQRADCVIEVVPPIDGQEKQVFFCFYWCSTLLGYVLTVPINGRKRPKLENQK